MVPAWLGMALVGPAIYTFMTDARLQDDALRVLTRGASYRTLSSRARFKGRKGRSAGRKIDRLHRLLRTAKGAAPRGWAWSDAFGSMLLRAGRKSPLVAESDRKAIPWWVFGLVGMPQKQEAEGPEGVGAQILLSGPSIASVGEEIARMYHRWFVGQTIAVGLRS